MLADFDTEKIEEVRTVVHRYIYGCEFGSKQIFEYRLKRIFESVKFVINSKDILPENKLQAIINGLQAILSDFGGKYSY